MTESKFSVKLGTLEFSGEGDEKWLALQLDKVLNFAITNSGKLFDPVRRHDREKSDSGSGASTEKTESLAALLKRVNATTDQTRKFLATAAWLHDRGKERLTTKDVAQALSQNSQAKLGNASQCLNNNVKTGACEKEGKTFFVTTEGKEALEK